ncbi:MAG: cbb3-type cytochrome c oxidase subunit I [Verrucomicrobiae bacterium]|nr:cbb3-type cytochrome c oxidase subunit I [Verrucomicrobiae bacterium]
MSTAPAETSSAHHHHDETHHHEPELNFFWKYIFSTDHKMIGLQYFWTSLAFLFLGGGLALLVRWKIAFPEVPFPILSWVIGAPYVVDGIIQPGFYNMFFTMHATIMVFFVIMPALIGGFGNFLIPLQIGARDMAFPILNGVSYWLYLLSGIMICASFIVPGGAANSGWTSYAPLSAVEQYNLTANGQALWCLSIFVNGLASIAGAVNYITTVINMRAPGMKMLRMPLTVWSLFITAILLLLAVPILSAAGVMLCLDLKMGTSFFIPSKGGDALLWQHLFWFFGHPEVYIMILPAMGIVSEIMPVFARKPIFGYKAMVYAMAAIAVIGFVVWGHHMFVSGMSLTLSVIFTASTMLIAVPSAIKVFNWLGTLWRGSITFTTPMLFSIGFVSMFIIGGLSGIFMASTPVDLFIHHTYFIVAHIHYVLFGGSIMSLFAGLYFWFPKMFGKKLDEGLGKIHFVLTFLFMNLTFFPMHNLGMAGMMRRIADPTLYEHLRNLQPINQFVTICAFILGFSQLIFFYNAYRTLRRGKKCEKNPWHANTLEWSLEYPIGHGNFPKIPTVYRGAYEYSVPGFAQDYIPQDQKLSQEEESRLQKAMASSH